MKIKWKKLFNVGRSWKAYFLKKFYCYRFLCFYKIKLQETVHALSALASQSEEEFLSLGEKLQEFSSLSTQIFQQTKLSLKKFEKNTDNNSLINTRHLLEKTSVISKSQDKNIDILFQNITPISEKLYKLCKMQDDFKKVSRFLRILGTSIKIESNQAGVKCQGFMVLGEEIDRIWSHITQGADDLFSQASNSACLLNAVKKNVTGNYQHHQASTSQIHKSIHSALREVETMFLLSSNTMKKIADCVQNISKKVGEIIYSLQAHDITRQQLEHIYQTLDMIEGRLEDAEQLEPAQFFELLQTTNQTLLIQISQLKNATEEMDQAANSIRGSLLEIAEKLEKENEEISVFKEDKNGRGKGKIDKLEDEISHITATFHQSQNLAEQISQALQPTTHSVNQMEKYMKEIEKVGYTINLLSLNALIKAAQDLESGQAFEVMAEEIRQQASNSSQLSEKACLELHALRIHNQEMEEAFHQLPEMIDNALSIVHLIKDNSLELQSLNQEVVEIIEQLTQKNSHLCSEIVTVANNIQFDHIFRITIMQNVRKLDSIQKEVQNFLLKNAHYQQEEKITTTEFITDHYTMEKERKIHQEAISSIVNEDMCAREGADRNNQETSPENELGDNVELF